MDFGIFSQAQSKRETPKFSNADLKSHSKLQNKINNIHSQPDCDKCMTIEQKIYSVAVTFNINMQ
jgi:hypothetical protein